MSAPGIGTEALLGAFPQAEVQAIDPSEVMVRQLSRRNSSAIHDGRLRPIEGTLSSLVSDARADIIVAVHVVYFWTDLATEFRRIRHHLRQGGVLALAYQLRAHAARRPT